MSVEEQVPLARYTTIGTGGPARFFAKPATLDELHASLRWAREEGHAVETIGLGSNLLVHDDGVDALVLKLAGELATAHVEGDVLVAGGGAANAVALHRARAAGLGGFEFASAIPGTAGGGVRMNAGAYGRDWHAVLIDAIVVDADGPRTVTLDELDLSYRHSGLAAGRGRRTGAVPTAAEHARGGEGAGGRVARATQGDAADEQAHVRQRLQEPEGERGAGSLIEACGLKGHRIGGALISPRHANFIENADGARSADCIALMAEARRRVHETFAIELRHEVQFLGPLDLPDL